MKLAEALQIRADLQKEIDDLHLRLMMAAKYQEGEKPVEDPNELLKELNDSTEKLSELIYKINYTNSVTKTRIGTLTKILAKKEALTLKRKGYDMLCNEATNIHGRYSKTEIKILPSVDVKELRKKMDLISKELREIELLIQETNWQVDLIEIDLIGMTE